MTVPTFAEVLSAVHDDGRAPYAWQERAVSELAENGWWPALRAPTGAGKTTLIDCWLHALARAGPDRLGRRLVWVVDRRAVVDQVFAYAEQLIARLTDGDAAPPARALAAALGEIGAGRPPRAVLWRGGLDDEGAIALREPLDPAAVAVIVSTVDQLGSRLLFRGYGLGIGSRALHAGLLGVDTTVVVDEAHIAEPLRATAERVAEIQREAALPPRPPLRVCAISATHDAVGAFELSRRERSEPAIAGRIGASKTARLAEQRTTKAIARLVDDLAGDGAKLIGVVLNTVAEARAAFEAMEGEPQEDRVLLIGPVRPLERADLLGAIPDRQQRSQREAPFVVVATQTIEVGVDLDLDALITACAPIDTLVQRFGRLDRAGKLGMSRAFVLPPPSKRDAAWWVYGEATTQTWEWLGEASDDGAIDFGVDALHATVRDSRKKPPVAAVPRTLRMLALHAHALSVTDALDQEGPAVELLLHGDRPPNAEVAIVWRRLSSQGAGSRPPVETVEAELALRPMHPGEAVTLSLTAARRWLAGESVGALSDVESLDADEERPEAAGGHARPAPEAWRVDPEGAVEALTNPRTLTPGDRLLVSATSGGLDGFGWAPDSTAIVPDLGSLSARGPRVVLAATASDVPGVAEGLEAGELTPAQAAGQLAEAIARALPCPDRARPTFSERVERNRAALASGRATPLEDGRVLVIARGARSEQASAGTIVTLDDHQRAVEAHAAEVLEALGLGPDIAGSVRRAARHHDEGKRDPRFQAWLRGGRLVEAGALAKSAYPYHPVRARRLRESAGWPKGKRHELASAAALARAHPRDSLAWWLAATHHGRNRPFPAAVPDDADKGLVALIDGTSVPLPADAAPSATAQLTTFAELSRQHGPWGLAFLEALLIGADRTVSAAEAAR